jgi:hypothetical protein
MNNQIRPSVKKFAETMESKLRKNEGKGGWQDESYAYLIQRLREEVDELETELISQPGSLHFSRSVWEKRVIEEAADVGNFALMIADKVSG